MKTNIKYRSLKNLFAAAFALFAVSVFTVTASAQSGTHRPQVARSIGKLSIPKAQSAQPEVATETNRTIFAQPDAITNAASYVFAVGTTGTFTDMSSGTTQLVGAGQDDAASPVTNIGFEFYMLGVRYTQFSASSNGFVRLGGTAVSTVTYTLGGANIPLITSLGSDNITATAGGKVHYKVTGAAPNRVLTVEFRNMTVIYDAAGATADCTSQVRLHETTGQIELVYGSMNRNSSTGFMGGMDPQFMGFSFNSTAGTSASVNTADTVNVAGAPTANQFPLSAPMASLNSPTDGSRKVYSFTPPTPTAPTALNFTAVTPIAMTLNWTDSPDESLYAIYRSTDGVNYSFAGTAALNATSFNATALAPNTNYFWRVYAVSDGALSNTALSGSQATTIPGVVTSTAAGGLWSSTATWAGGVVPTNTDNVTIVTGANVTVDVTTAVALNVTVQSGGTLQYITTPASTLTLGLSLTIDSGGVVTAGTGTLTTHVLSVGGDLTNNGTLDLFTTAGVGLTFTGPTSNTFGGTGATTDIRTMTLNKGTSNTNILELNPTNFTVQGVNTDVAGFLTITNGTLKISGNFTMTNRTFAVAGYAIPAAGGFWLNNPNYTIAAQNGTGTVTGLYRLTQGTHNQGTIAGNSLALASGSTAIIEGGAINSSGRVAVTAAGNLVNYTQTGGIITVCIVGNASGTLGSFDLGTNSGSIVTMSGGTIICQLAATAIDYRYDADPTNLTGTTVQLGNASSGAAKNFSLRGVLPNLVITNASAAHTATFNGTLVNFYHVITGNVTINTGNTLNLAGDVTSVNTFFEGNILNNGTLNASNINMSCQMVGLGAQQTYSGTGTMTAPTTEMDIDGGGVDFTGAVNQQVIARINLFSGSLTGADKVTLGNGGATSGTIQIGNGGPPATSAGPVTGTIVNNAGTGGYVVIYGEVDADRDTGGEIPVARTVSSVTFDSAGPNVTIAGGNLTTSAITFGDVADTASNGRVITGANTLILASGGTVTRVGGLGHVDGSFRKTYPAAGSQDFEVGTANGYSPVTVNVTAGTFPADFTTKAVQGRQPNMSPATSLQRYWTLTAVGVTADLTFNYLDPTDIMGNEANYAIFLYDGALSNPGGTVNTAANTATITGTMSFPGGNTPLVPTRDWTLGEPGSPLSASSALSRKTHGGAGDFDINLPLTGSPGIECRNTGGTETVIITFSNNVVSGTASVSTGTGVAGAPVFSANTMTIPLTGVTDVQQIAVTASNVMDVFAQVLPSTVVPMKVLIGDTNNSSSVSAGDVSQTKAQSGNGTTGANFRTDVNASGGISAADVSQVKSKAGNSLP